MKVTEIISAQTAKKLQRPLFISEVPAGFPSPAEDYIDKRLDLNEHLIRHPAATYFVKASGDSMKNAGIHSGDLLIVDRSLEAQHKNVVIAAYRGELTVKRFHKFKNKIYLMPENPNYAPIEISPEEDFEIWGVVTYVIHCLSRL